MDELLKHQPEQELEDTLYNFFSFTEKGARIWDEISARMARDFEEWEKQDKLNN